MKLNFECNDCGLGLAQHTAPDGCGADLCSAQWLVRRGRDCRGGRRRRAGTGGANAAAVRPREAEAGSNDRQDSGDGSGGPGGSGRGSGGLVGGRMVANATGLLNLSNLKRLTESGAVSHPLVRHASRIGAPPIYPHDLLGSMQKPRSENRLQPSWDYRGLSKPAKNEARCRWRRKLGAAELWGKSRPRKMLARSGTCRGTRGSG